jgi:hypothetical protein
MNYVIIMLSERFNLRDFIILLSSGVEFPTENCTNNQQEHYWRNIRSQTSHGNKLGIMPKSKYL